MNALMPLYDERRLRPGQAKSQALWLLVGLGLVAYLIPWLVNPGAGLSLNAYDLAEWASLHPASRASQPLLFVSLLLRLPLPCLALIIALREVNLTNRIGWLRVLAVAALSTAVLPPLEFFTGAIGDPNYQQQFALAVVAAAGGIIGLSGRAIRIHRIAVLAISMAGIAASILGVAYAYDLMQQFKLPVQLGLGVFLLSAVYLGVVIEQVRY